MGEGIAEEEVINFCAWHVMIRACQLLGNKRVSEAPELVNRVNCYRTLVVGEGGSLRMRLWSQG